MWSRMPMHVTRRVAVASLVTVMSAGGIALPGCAAQDGSGQGGTAPETGDVTATEPKNPEDAIPQKGDGGIDVGELGGAKALGDLADYPDGTEERVREDLSEVAESLSDDEIRYAAAMLHHLEDKYGTDFTVVSVRPPVLRDSRDSWVAVFECQDESLAYGDGDDTAALHLRKPGDLRQVSCQATKDGDSVILSDDMVLQLRGGQIGDAIAEATNRAVDAYGGIEVKQGSFIRTPTQFRRDRLSEADALPIDADASAVIPLVEFDSVGTVGVELPEGRDAMELAEGLATEVRKSYAEIGISGDWSLTLMLGGDMSQSTVLRVTADGVENLMPSDPAGDAS